ncbi:MAG: hypothetical protein KF841_07845 [Phycisphaerae bacterium]|nr:hypothetical protein [Phycisphaerae bacterium]
MSAPHDFIPRRDGDFDAWQKNYVAYAIANSPALGLSHADVDALEDLQTGWRKKLDQNTEALALAEASTAAKRDARAAFEQFIRSLSARIRATPTIDDAERAALGLSLVSGPPSAATAPCTFPVLSLAGADRLIHRVRFADSEMPLRKARPRGTVGAELRLILLPPGATPPADPADFDFLQLATRTPALVEFAAAQGGLTAHYVARWLNAKGQQGPWSATLSATVMG